MKRKTEHVMEMPLLEVIAFPGEQIPVSIVVSGDFEISGDINISMGVDDEQLIEVQRLLLFVVNDIADELHNRAINRKPPFEVTGGNVPKNTPSE